MTRALALMLLLLAGGQAASAQERGRDPFAFRAVLDERPRMLVLALRRDFWAAWDAERAALYKLWDGGIEFTGAVYDWKHGPQPRSRGRSWLVSPWSEPWQLRRGGETRAAAVRWRGHRLVNGRAELLYDLVLDDGSRIELGESPEAVRAADGTRGLERRFTTHGVPARVEVLLRVELDSFPAGRPFTTDGRFEQARTAPGGSLDGVLVLRANGATRFTHWLAEPKPEEGLPAPDLPAGLARIGESDCRTCHDPERRTVGPGFREIARRYRDQADEIARLARRVMLGATGAWGEAVMTPHPDLSPADAEAMVAWILAQDDPPPEPAARSLLRRLPDWSLEALLALGAWWWGESGPHGIDVERLLPGVHPSFDLETIRPAGFEPRVGGLGGLADGRIAVATWDAIGAVYLLDPSGGVKRIAAGLLEPLGLAVVDGSIYVLQKHELTRLVDEDGDETIDRYETVSDRWHCSANFHEFSFGLAHHGGFFYANLGSAIEPGGASSVAQAEGRGSVVRISPRDGSVEVVARGLRVPNGIGFGAGDRLFVTDNQGDWLPASKLLRVRDGAFFGSYSIDFPGREATPVTPPVAWLPHAEVANSPSEPVGIEIGPWRGQLVFGDVHYGGIQRAFVEEVEGVLQGAVFRFSQGFEAGVNRLAWGPDGKLYVGGIGGPGDWGQPGKLWYGLERLAWNGRETFDLLALRIRPDGLEIELTMPLGPRPVAREDFVVRDWTYRPTAEYGGPKLDVRELPVRWVALSPDRRRIVLGLDALAVERVLHLEVVGPLAARDGQPLWSREAWYTVNHVPTH